MRTGGCASCAAAQCHHYVHPPVPRCPYCLAGPARPRAGQRPGRRPLLHRQPPAVDPGVRPLRHRAGRPSPSKTTSGSPRTSSDSEPDDVRIGMEVEVTFEHVDDVWLPLFAPARRTRTAARAGLGAMSRPELLERRSIISGIGQSAVGRRLGRGELDLTVDAACRPSPTPGSPATTSTGWPPSPGLGVGTGGFAGPPTPEVQDALRLKLNWHDGGGEGPGQIRAVFAACLAVAAGPGPPRPRLPHRHRVQRPGRGWAPGDRRRRAGGRRHAPLLGLHAVDAPLRRGVRRQLAGPGRPAPHVRVRARPASSWPRSPSTAGATPASTPRPSTATP